jgi:hypothetical protein
MLISERRSWVIDSGATQHLCYDKVLFTTFKPCYPSRYFQGIATELLEITGSGTIRIKTSSGTDLVLNNVNYAPKGPVGRHEHLISTSRLADDYGCVATFFGDVCSIANVFQWGPSKTFHLVPVWSGTRIDHTYWLDELDETHAKQDVPTKQYVPGCSVQ